MMAYNGKSLLEMDDLGVPPFMETPIYYGKTIELSVLVGFYLYL